MRYSGDSIFILDKSDQVIALLSNSLPSSTPYWDDEHHEILENGYETFEFKTVLKHPTGVPDQIREENKILIRDMDGISHIFRIRRVKENTITKEKNVFAETEAVELLNDPVRPMNISGTPSIILGAILQPSRWQPGIVETGAINTLNVEEYSSVLAQLHETARIFNLEIRFRIEFTNRRITGRFVDLLQRRGNPRGGFFEYSQDIKGLTRTKDTTELATALIGVGRSDQNENVMTFKNVIWNRSSGHPADKPGGQDWIGDPAALQQFGVEGRHIFRVYTSDQTDPSRLLAETWDELQRRIKGAVEYEVDLLVLERLAGYEHKAVRIGDTITIKDTSFTTPLVLEARVLELKRSRSNPANDAITLGEYREREVKEIELIRQLQSELARKAAQWESGFDVTESDVAPLNPYDNQYWLDTSKEPNIWMRYSTKLGRWVPGTPSDATQIDYKDGLPLEHYKPAQPGADVTGDNVSKDTGHVGGLPSETVKDNINKIIYEVGNGTFETVDGALVKAGPISPTPPYDPQPGQKWIDTSNPDIEVWKRWDGTTKSWVEIGRVSFDQMTGLVKGNQIGLGEVGEQQLADLAVTLKKLANDSVDVSKIVDAAISEAKIQTDAITNVKIAANAVDINKIVDNAISSAKIQSSAVTDAKIAANAVTTAKILDGAIANAKIAASAVTDAKIATGAVTTTKILDGAIANAKIAADAVTDVKIATGAITTTKLVDDAIIATKIAANAVTDVKIAANAVTAIKVMDGAVLSAKLADNAVTMAKIGTGQVSAAQILDRTINRVEIALAGIQGENVADRTLASDKIVANTITGGEIAANTITAGQMAAATITAAQIATDTITASQIAANAVTTSEILAGAVTANEIAANTITAANIAASTITATQIAGTTITGNKLVSSTITATQIASNAITAVKIAANAVTTDKLIANAVTAAKIAAGTITANEISTGAITAEKIGAGAITADKIAAGAIVIGSDRTTFAAGYDPTQIQIGGRNFVRKSDQFNKGGGAAKITPNLTDEGYLEVVTETGNGNWFTGWVKTTTGIEENFVEGEPFTISFTVKSPDSVGKPTIYIKSGMGYYPLVGTMGPEFSTLYYSGTWKKNNTIIPHLGFSGAVGTFIFKNWKIEKGNKPTDWTPAFEDQNEQAQTYATEAAQPANDRIKLWERTGTTYIDGGQIFTDSVTANQIAAGAVTANEIAANAITADKIAANAITIGSGTNYESGYNPKTAIDRVELWTQTGTTFISGGQIFTDSITANQIAAGAITTSEIATNAVTANEIAAGTITASNIAGTTITGNKLVANTITAAQLAAKTVTAAQIAATTITGAEIASNAITAVKITGRTITADKLVASSVTANEIAANTITGAKIAGGTITGDKIVANTISADKLVFNSITGAHIATDAITTDEIAAGSITTDLIAASGISADVIKTGTLGANTIFAGTLQAAKGTFTGTVQVGDSYTDLGVTTVSGSGVESDKINLISSTQHTRQKATLKAGYLELMYEDANYALNGKKYGSLEMTPAGISVESSMDIIGDLNITGQLSALNRTSNFEFITVKYINNSGELQQYGNATFRGSNNVFKQYTSFENNVSMSGSIYTYGTRTYYGNETDYAANEPTTNRNERGYCGVAGYPTAGTYNAVGGVGVNFRKRRMWTPSSIGLSMNTMYGGSISYTDLTVDGFWLYLNGNGTTSYQYWRGYYTVY